MAGAGFGGNGEPRRSALRASRSARLSARCKDRWRRSWETAAVAKRAGRGREDGGERRDVAGSKVACEDVGVREAGGRVEDGDPLPVRAVAAQTEVMAMSFAFGEDLAEREEDGCCRVSSNRSYSKGSNASMEDRRRSETERRLERLRRDLDVSERETMSKAMELRGEAWKAGVEEEAGERRLMRGLSAVDKLILGGASPPRDDC